MDSDSDCDGVSKYFFEDTYLSGYEASSSSSAACSSSASETSFLSPPMPKRAKSKHYDSKFQDAWLTMYDGIKRSRKGESYALCIYCKSDFSVASGGKHDIERHIQRVVKLTLLLRQKPYLVIG